MAKKTDKQFEEALYRADTVPPPDGESDAYSAPTRVGTMPADLLDAMKLQMQHAQASAAAHDRPQTGPSSRVQPSAEPSRRPPMVPVPPFSSVPPSAASPTRPPMAPLPAFSSIPPPAASPTRPPPMAPLPAFSSGPPSADSSTHPPLAPLFPFSSVPPSLDSSPPRKGVLWAVVGLVVFLVVVLIGLIVLSAGLPLFSR